MTCVLLTDADRFPLPDRSLRRLDDAGARLVELSGHDPQDIVAVARREHAAAILVYHAHLDAPVLDHLDGLRVVGRCGTGYDLIDVGAARARGIEVTYVPDYGVDDVADHALALILACCRGIVQCSEAVRAGAWPNYREFGPLYSLRGRTLGLLGFGLIARALARRASVLGMEMVAHDPGVNDAQIAAAGVRPVAFDELLRGSHVISLHVPLSPTTSGLLNDSAFGAMQSGVVVINTSRGGLIDEEALLRGLAGRRVAAAGLDVFAQEPLPDNHPLRSDPRVVATPHTAAFSEEALAEVADRSVCDVLRVLAGEPAQDPAPCPMA
jgi:D-3-phosphoglycerate dehydrogenase